MPITFTTTKKQIADHNYILVKFEIKDVLDPSELKRLNPPEVPAKHGVILSGRGPVWLYGFLVHFYHPSCFVGVYDPRLGAVVVESHVRNIEAGDVIPVED